MSKLPLPFSIQPLPLLLVWPLKSNFTTDRDQVVHTLQKEQSWEHEMWVEAACLIFDGSTDVLGQSTPKALVAGGQLQPRPPLPVCDDIAVLGGSIRAVAMAVVLVLFPDQFTVYTEWVE